MEQLGDSGHQQVRMLLSLLAEQINSPSQWPSCLELVIFPAPVGWLTKQQKENDRDPIPREHEPHMATLDWLGCWVFFDHLSFGWKLTVHQHVPPPSGAKPLDVRTYAHLHI